MEIDGRLYNVAHDVSKNHCLAKQALMLAELKELDNGRSEHAYTIQTIRIDEHANRTALSAL